MRRPSLRGILSRVRDSVTTATTSDDKGLRGCWGRCGVGVVCLFVLCVRRVWVCFLCLLSHVGGEGGLERGDIGLSVRQQGWFFADRQMLSAVDSGLDSKLSDSEARRQLDAIYGTTQPVE